MALPSSAFSRPEARLPGFDAMAEDRALLQGICAGLRNGRGGPPRPEEIAQLFSRSSFPKRFHRLVMVLYAPGHRRIMVSRAGQGFMAVFDRLLAHPRCEQLVQGAFRLQLDFMVEPLKAADLYAMGMQQAGDLHFEVGVDGLIYRGPDEKVHLFLPGDAYVRSVMTMGQLRDRLHKSHGEEYVRQARFSRFRTESFLSATDSWLRLYRGYPVVGALSREKIEQALAIAISHIRLTQDEQGKFLYYYDAASDSRRDHEHPGRDPVTNPYYNILRHCGGGLTCIHYEKLDHQGETQDNIRRAIDYLVDTSLRTQSYPDGEGAYVYSERKSKLGGAGIALYTLVEYELLTGDRQYRVWAERLARHLLHQITESGEFIYYNIYLDREITAAENQRYFSFYYPGEAICGLAKYLHLLDAGDREPYFSKLREALHFLLVERPRTRAEHYTAVPSDSWLMMGICELWDFPAMRDSAYADFVFRDARQMIEHMYKVNDAPYPDYAGAFYYDFGDSPYADGARCEGLLGAYALAAKMGDRQKMAELWPALRLAAWSLMHLVNTEDAIYFAPNPAIALGGIRFKYTRQWFRIDTIQHVASFFAKLLAFWDAADSCARTPDIPWQAAQPELPAAEPLRFRRMEARDSLSEQPNRPLAPSQLDATDHLDAVRHLLVELGLLDEYEAMAVSPTAIMQTAMLHISPVSAPQADLLKLRASLEAECRLAEGDTGSRVRQLQEFLRRLGHHHGPADGVYGVATTAAVKCMQRVLDLTPTGIADIATLVAIRKASKSLFSVLDSKVIADLAGGNWGGAPPAPRIDCVSLLPTLLPRVELVPIGRNDVLAECFSDPRHRHILCDVDLETIPPHISFLRVDRTIRGLARLARHARSHLRGKVIAITGSSGKTTTKEMLRAALAGQGITHASSGSANSTSAICQGLVNAPLAADWLIFESGLGAGGSAIRDHSELLRPDVAIVTSVDPAHAEGYVSLEDIARRKLEIAANLKADGALLVDADSELHSFFLDTARELRVERVFGFGVSEKNAIRVLGHQVSLGGTQVELMVHGSRHAAQIPMVGGHWAKMLAAVAGACAALETNIDQGLAALSKLVIPSGRGRVMHIPKAGGDMVVFDSHYNANPGSMAADLRAYMELAGVLHEPRRVAVIGEYKELGALEAAAHYQLGGLLLDAGFERIFLIGSNHGETLRSLQNSSVEVYETIDEALPSIVRQAVAGDLVFIKGSNSNNLYKVVPALQR